MVYSLNEKLSNKRYEENVAVLGNQYTFQSLNAGEEEEIVRSAGASSFIELLNTRRVPTLARAIRAIDGVFWEQFEEVKQRVRSEDNPLSLIQAVEAELRTRTEDDIATLYIAYSDFRLKHQQKQDALKKSSKAPNPVSAG